MTGQNEFIIRSALERRGGRLLRFVGGPLHGTQRAHPGPDWPYCFDALERVGDLFASTVADNSPFDDHIPATKRIRYVRWFFHGQTIYVPEAMTDSGIADLLLTALFK